MDDCSPTRRGAWRAKVSSEPIGLIPVAVAALACLWLILGSAPVRLRAAATNPPSLSPSTPTPSEAPTAGNVESLVIVVPDERMNEVRALLSAETDLRLVLGELPRAATIVGAPDVITAQSIADAVRADASLFSAAYDAVFIAVPGVPDASEMGTVEPDFEAPMYEAHATGRFGKRARDRAIPKAATPY